MMNRIIYCILCITIMILVWDSSSMAQVVNGTTTLYVSGQDTVNGQDGRFQLHTTADVFPYVIVSITNPTILWRITVPGTGTAPGPQIDVQANCAFDISISSVDDLTNTNPAYPPNYATGANLLTTWYALSRGRAAGDNPFKVAGAICGAMINAHSGMPSPPGYGILETVLRPEATSGHVIRNLWNRIRVEGNDMAGNYKDLNGFWITVSGHL